MPTPQHAAEIARELDNRRSQDSLGMQVAFWTGAAVSGLAFVALLFTWLIRH